MRDQTKEDFYNPIRGCMKFLRSHDTSNIKKLSSNCEFHENAVEYDNTDFYTKPEGIVFKMKIPKYNHEHMELQDDEEIYLTKDRFRTSCVQSKIEKIDSISRHIHLIFSYDLTFSRFANKDVLSILISRIFQVCSRKFCQD